MLIATLTEVMIILLTVMSRPIILCYVLVACVLGGSGWSNELMMIAKQLRNPAGSGYSFRQVGLTLAGYIYIVHTVCP